MPHTMSKFWLPPYPDGTMSIWCFIVKVVLTLALKEKSPSRHGVLAHRSRDKWVDRDHGPFLVDLDLSSLKPVL